MLDLIPGVNISLEGSANRIADVLFIFIQSLVEFAQQKCFFGYLGKKQVNRIDVAVSHSENVVRLLNQLAGQRPAALEGNINPQFLESAHRMGAGGLSIHSAHPR